jgi:hypothetical protein
MSFDLNLDNYKYDDLVAIFKIKGHSTNQIKSIRAKCNHVKRNYPEDIYLFYYKASKALECILTLVEQNQLLPNDVCLNDYLQQIKNVYSFETYETLDLIEKLKPSQPEPIVNIVNNPIAPGKINTIKRILQTQNLHLHSCFRQNTLSSSSDYQYNLPSEIKHVVSMRLASIEIPNTRYLFSSKQKNNTFLIQINQESFCITIPDGNYTNESLEEYLNSTYFDSMPLQQIHFYIDRHFHSFFESSIPFTIHFGDNSIQNCGWILGFRNDCYTNQTCIKSEGLFDAIGDRYIFLSVEDYQYNTNITNMVGINRNFIDKSILAKVPMNDEKLALIIHDTNPLCKVRQYNGPVTLKKFHIKILDKFGNVIDLNNMDFSFTLELEVLYENFNS